MTGTYDSFTNSPSLRDFFFFFFWWSVAKFEAFMKTADRACGLNALEIKRQEQFPITPITPILNRFAIIYFQWVL